MINKSGARRAWAAFVVFSITGFIYALEWYDMMFGPVGGAA